MARHNRQRSYPTKPVKHPHRFLPLLTTGLLFAVIAGVVFYTAGRRSSADGVNRATVNTSISYTPTKTVKVNGQVAEVNSHKPLQHGITNSAEKVTAPISQQADHPAPAPRETIRAQLAAGEFGPALETAQAVVDARRRAQLLRLIADTEIEAGEFEAARTAVRRIPSGLQRTAGRPDARQTLAGGTSGADFGPLIDLIQTQTSGPWLEIDAVGGTMKEFESGVRVDPNGLLHRLTRQEQTRRLKQLGIDARVADLNEDMARSSSLRLVSLTRLEREISKRFDEGQPVLETMKHLAGLSVIRYVIVDPDQGEVIIGGPAEGWRYDERGLPVGAESGRPTLQLDDFVTVFRTFASGGEGFFNCLIVPRQENMRKLEAYVARSNARGPIRAGGGVRSWVRSMQGTLGEQDVRVNGVPLDSRVARVIVEADYRMKLIGIDKLDGGDIPSYFDLLPLSQETAPTATIGLRWWMTMKYDTVMHSADRDIFELQGSSVLCLSEDEMITADGKRIHTGKSSPTNRLFAANFTQHYAELAQRDTVFADMQNIFDLSLVAALIRNERLDERTGWDPGVFAAGGAYRPVRYEPPKTVMSVANHRVYNGRDVVVQVAGGVRADLMSVVEDRNVFREAKRLENVAGHGKAPQLPAGRWWWDAGR